jgi:hypothetical protein
VAFGAAEVSAAEDVGRGPGLYGEEFVEFGSMGPKRAKLSRISGGEIPIDHKLIRGHRSVCFMGSGYGRAERLSYNGMRCSVA